MSLNASIGLRISELRKSRHMTQEQLAEKLDISIKHCSAVERGISCLSLEKLIEVSDYFDVSLDYLVKGNSINPNDVDYIYPFFPNSIISVMTSRDDEERELFQEYLQLYRKLRTTQHKKE